MSTKNILVIIGSASRNSANEKLVDYLIRQMEDGFTFTVFSDLKVLPHFDPELTSEHTPNAIVGFRNEVAKADGIIICTPEYVFSIPSGLKNAIEWCVSTTVFSDKPTGLITASASGEKGHEELMLLMKTLMAKFIPETTLLIRGIKGKMGEHGALKDADTQVALGHFISSFKKLLTL